MVSRRTFLRTTLLGGAGLVVGSPVYARYVEPRWLELNQVRVPLGLKRPVRLLHLADFHLSNVVPLPHIQRAIEAGLDTSPDLICITGDFISGRLEQQEAYREVLQTMAARHPTFASLGNHDGGIWVGSRGGYPTSRTIRLFLEECGIHCLHNRNESLEVGATRLDLVGVGDLWSSELDTEQAFSGMDPSAARPRRLLLSHNPDTKDILRGQSWDLMLSGHTHGGQVYLPGLGAPFAPVKDHRYIHGLYPWEGRYLHITKGVGSVLGLRFNCRPEVSVLDLV